MTSTVSSADKASDVAKVTEEVNIASNVVGSGVDPFERVSLSMSDLTVGTDTKTLATAGTGMIPTSETLVADTPNDPKTESSPKATKSSTTDILLMGNLSGLEAAVLIEDELADSANQSAKLVDEEVVAKQPARPQKNRRAKLIIIDEVGFELVPYDDDGESDVSSLSDAFVGEEDPPYEDTDEESCGDVYWRLEYRRRHDILWDRLVVNKQKEGKPLSRFEKSHNGMTDATRLQFLHRLNDRDYSNNYIITLDDSILEYLEGDDVYLPIKDGEPAPTTPSQKNKALDDIVRVFGMNLNVRTSIWESNRSCHMGSMNLSEFENSITSRHLNLYMDSLENMKQIIKLHKSPLEKISLKCNESYAEIVQLEQIRTTQFFQAVGTSNITDSDLLMLEAIHFDIESEKITSEGINTLIKARLMHPLPYRFCVRVRNESGGFRPRQILEGLNYTLCKESEEFEHINGIFLQDIYPTVHAYVPIPNSTERLVVNIGSQYFETYKETHQPIPLEHDFFYI